METAQIIVAFVFGVAFVVALLVLAIKFPTPTPFQYSVFRIVLALAAAGVAAMIPGFINIEVSASTQLLIRAGGAIAVFVVGFFFNPAQLAVQNTAAPTPDTQIASLVGVLDQRAEEIQSDLEKVIEKLSTLHKDDAIKQLKVFVVRFVRLHEKHLAAIKANDLYLSHEIVGQIHEVLVKIRSLVSSTVGAVGRDWYASLGRAYVRAPTREEDPNYAAIQDDLLKLNEATTSRTDAMHYPGAAPPGASKSFAALVFGPPDTPPKSSL